MNLKQFIKMILVKECRTFTSVVDEMNKRNDEKKTRQNYTTKLTNNTIKYTEVEQIADILGYKIEWVKK